jgi:hypothetical protein
LLEIGGAIFHDKLLYGNVGKLLENYLCKVFRIIQWNDYARGRVEALRDSEDTFQNIKRFRKSHLEVINIPYPGNTIT